MTDNWHGIKTQRPVRRTLINLSTLDKHMQLSIKELEMWHMSNNQSDSDFKRCGQSACLFVGL